MAKLPLRIHPRVSARNLSGSLSLIASMVLLPVSFLVASRNSMNAVRARRAAGRLPEVEEERFDGKGIRALYDNPDYPPAPPPPRHPAAERS